MKANKLIEKRAQLSSDITKYWNIISVENVVNKNYKRTYDLKSLFDTIKILANERIMTKLKILYLNLGITKLEDISINCNQYDVFRLCELQEMKVHLNRIKTINPVLKAKKGKKALSKTEALSSNWIKARVEELDLEIIKIKEKLTKFNEEADLDESKQSENLTA